MSGDDDSSSKENTLEALSSSLVFPVVTTYSKADKDRTSSLYSQLYELSQTEEWKDILYGISDNKETPLSKKESQQLQRDLEYEAARAKKIFIDAQKNPKTKKKLKAPPLGSS